MSSTHPVILVTGGSGLVGAAIRRALPSPSLAHGAPCPSLCASPSCPGPAGARYVFLSSRDCDLRVRAEVDALFERVRPTMVVHLAAYVGGLYANLAQPVEFFRYNLLMNDNVMEACRVHKVDKLVSCLSTCIFPDDTRYPIDETMLHLGPPHPSNAPYAYAKRLADTMSRAYRAQYGCNFVTIVPTNVFGPNDNFSVAAGHVIPGLIHKAHTAARDGKDLVVWGSGTPLRQFIHADDLAALTLWVLRDYNDAEPIILAPDAEDEVSIADVARMIAEETAGLGADRLVFDTSKSDGQHKKTASNAKLRALRPDYVFTPIREGIRDTVAWFRTHADEARK